MWYKGFLMTLALILVLGFSMGCEPEHEDPMEEPMLPEEYGEPPPDEYLPPEEGEPGEEPSF
ncbi:hypothetical protein [Desulfonatronospira sp.]|uniref:hypothetical protein n=1 Tax=Desulfonatronospira sp. TaxID=1962951 RepID=UPI0025BA0E97|nr:hypothetical protein [Desulfonatronospira sp.]